MLPISFNFSLSIKTQGYGWGECVCVSVCVCLCTHTHTQAHMCAGTCVCHDTIYIPLRDLLYKYINCEKILHPIMSHNLGSKNMVISLTPNSIGNNKENSS